MSAHYPDTSISHLGKYAQMPTYVTHSYTCHTPIVATGKKGIDPGELNHASGVAIHEDTHQIFVANYFNYRVEIFSETGEYLYQLGVGQLSMPYGIVIHGDSVYVSCWGDHTVSKFSLSEMCHVKRIGGGDRTKQQSRRFRYSIRLCLYQLGVTVVMNQRYVIHGDSVYVCCITLLAFSL